MVIELLGTPGSGKDTVINQISSKYPITILQAEYSKQVNQGQFEIKILRSILDTYVRLDQRATSRSKALLNVTTILNRGILDRIAWCRFLSETNPAYTDVAKDLENALHQSGLLKTIDLFCLFISPYNLVKKRKESSYETPHVLNCSAISLLNSIYLKIFQEFCVSFPILLIDESGAELTTMEKTKLVENAVIKVGLN